MKTCSRCGKDFEGFDDQCDPCTFRVIHADGMPPPIGKRIVCPVGYTTIPSDETIGDIRFVSVHEIRDKPDVKRTAGGSPDYEGIGREIAEGFHDNVGSGVLRSLTINLANGYARLYRKIGSEDVAKRFDDVVTELIRLL